MITNVGSYGSFSKRDEPTKKEAKPKRVVKRVIDVYNPFSIYDYDVNYSKKEDGGNTDG